MKKIFEEHGWEGGQLVLERYKKQNKKKKKKKKMKSVSDYPPLLFCERDPEVLRYWMKKLPPPVPYQLIKKKKKKEAKIESKNGSS